MPSTFAGRGQTYGSAVRFERNRSCLQNSYQLKPLGTAGQRPPAGLDTFKEMLANCLERFLLLDVRNVAVPIMIGVLKLRECVVVGRPFHPNVVDADFFVRLQVVVYDHSPGPDDRHFPDFPRLEPAALDRGKTLMAKGQRHVRDVLDMRRDMSVTRTIDCNWEFSKNVENDRDVVRREIPGDIDVLLEEAQIESAAN